MKIIFVCTGNTCRSPMAEYILRNYCKKNNLDIEVQSRGIDCGNGYPIAENSRLALKELGIDASEHTSKCFDLQDLNDSDLVIAMTKNHKDLLDYYFGKNDKVKTFDDVADIGDIRDPYGFSIEVYRACRNRIEEGVKNLILKLQNK